MLPTRDTEQLVKYKHVRIFLGVSRGVPYFALGLKHDPIETGLLPKNDHVLLDLKTVALRLPGKHSTLLSYARSLVYWNWRHQYCPNCGQVTQSSGAGHVRKCSDSKCDLLHFPRTDTAVIALIKEGDACLLGRQPVWQPGLYAPLAGFLEPGETLEQAVAREAMEEAGVVLEQIVYHSSQPWPFPSSIMVGFTATAQSRTLRIAQEELEDARWFTRGQIKHGLRGGTFRLPPPLSISYGLIRDWFEADGDFMLTPLKES
ncbi:MAG: NAD(+) diphosphatase [Pontibacter sp.]|nr:NAD(+) diphosphatase [Pontibacter sp.]